MKESRLWKRKNPEQVCFLTTPHRNDERVMSLEQSGTGVFSKTPHRNNERVMSLEQSGRVYFLNTPHRNNERVTQVTGSGCCPGTRHRALMVPATNVAVPVRPSPSRSWSAPGRPREKLIVPSVSAPAQKRWNHRPWSLAKGSGPGSASGEVSTSIGSSSRRSPQSSSPTPSASPAG